MASPSTKVLDTALEEADAEWEEEVKDPQLRRAHLWRDFRSDHVVPLVLVLAVLVADLIGLQLFIALYRSWPPKASLSLFLLAGEWMMICGLPVLAVLAAVQGYVTWTRYGDYRRLMATPPEPSPAPPVR